MLRRTCTYVLMDILIIKTKRMKQLFLLTYLANIALLINVYFALPEQMIAHGGPDGPDGWSSKEFFIIALILVDTFFFLSLLSTLMDWENLPHNDRYSQ